MLTPSEISSLLDIDEDGFLDDISTHGNPARKAFLRGVAANTRELNENVIDAARAGSPFSISECLEKIEKQLSNSL